ncbi:hypothetical protein MPUL_36400 [Mycolicibacterium pulveris]|uniref:Uncharacterized protein n=1 Tax=Mycolicibacterium pulveris TaxID=36813 RepID=A0A7I7UM23_MYCPV|nr:hypothetical protein MPUL_36400 [Mycolicibacterium pulveris]
MPRPSLVASRGPSPVRGFIAAIECSLHNEPPAGASSGLSVGAESAHPLTAPGTELLLNASILPYRGGLVCKDPA